MDGENRLTGISPEDLQRGKEAFLLRLDSKIAEGGGIGAAAQRLKSFYLDNPDKLDNEVSDQLSINSNDLLGEAQSPESKITPRIEMPPVEDGEVGPVEERIMDLIQMSEESVSQQELLRKITGKLTRGSKRLK